MIYTHRLMIYRLVSRWMRKFVFIKNRRRWRSQSRQRIHISVWGDHAQGSDKQNFTELTVRPHLHFIFLYTILLSVSPSILEYSTLTRLTWKAQVRKRRSFNMSKVWMRVSSNADGLSAASPERSLQLCVVRVKWLSRRVKSHTG